jgi:hypothetical protein
MAKEVVQLQRGKLDRQVNARPMERLHADVGRRAENVLLDNLFIAYRDAYIGM